MARHDDPILAGDLVLWRRIPPWCDRVTLDPQTGELRPSSTNFRDKNDELSVYVAAETTVESVLAGHDGFGLVGFTAAEIRQLVPGIILCRDPEPHPVHVLICAKLTRSQATHLAKLCAHRWVVRPQDLSQDQGDSQ